MSRSRLVFIVFYMTAVLIATVQLRTLSSRIIYRYRVSVVARNRINVNCVCPGLVRTSMQEREIGWEAKLRGMSKEEVTAEYHNAVPLGRLEEPEDAAKLVLFLASEDAAYMTGQAVNVAGGMEMAV